MAASVPHSAFHPRHLNPLHSTTADLAPVSRADLASDGRHPSGASADAEQQQQQQHVFQRDREGESVLSALLVGLLGTPATTPAAAPEDVNMAPASTADDDDDDDPAVLDFRLFASRPVGAIRLVPLVVEHVVPNPTHADLSPAALSLLRHRAQSSSTSFPFPSVPPRSSSLLRHPRPIPHYNLEPGISLPTLACTSRPNQTANSRMRAHGLPLPSPPERGPGGHLPCPQLSVSLANPDPGLLHHPSSTSKPIAASASKRKRKRPLPKKHRSRPTAPPRPQPAFYRPPVPTGYAYGYPSSSPLLPSPPPAAHQRPTTQHDEDVVYERDRLRAGWVDKKGGESWWGHRKDKGGPKARELAKSRRKAFWG